MRKTQNNHAVVHTSKRIYEMFKSQIVEGNLRIGAKLPSTRALAIEQGISRTTVTVVYEQLAAEGYIETSVGAAPRVAAVLTKTPDALKTSQRSLHELQLSTYSYRTIHFDLPIAPIAPAAHSVIDFLYGALSPADFPTLAWRRAYDRALRQQQPWLYYATAQGDPALRVELQGYLRRARGLICHADQILVVNGSQQAIDLCARVLLDPGDRVAIEEPCYLMAYRVFKAAGANVQEVPVDENGLITRALPKQRIKLVYVTPSHQFPLGGVMPIARRQELLAWARHNGAWVVEDDYDGEFRHGLRPVDALQSIDEIGSVIYIGTFSKALSPQLRIGYMVLPALLLNAFCQAKTLTDRHTPHLEQVALGSLIRSGAYERHIRRMRRDNERRRTTILQSIKQYLPANSHVEGAAAGLHIVLWVTNLRASDEAELVVLALKQGVGIRPISPMYTRGQTHRKRDCPGFVLGYAGLDHGDIKRGICKLAAVVAQFDRESPVKTTTHR